jgi:hypothetical protein
MSQVKSISQMKLFQKVIISLFHSYFVTFFNFKSCDLNSLFLSFFPRDSYCITTGTSKKINPNQFGWYYESCSKCTKSSRGMGDTYTCSCGQEVKAPIARFVFCHKNQLFYGYTSFATLPNYNAHCATRYKVVVQVESQGDKANFVYKVYSYLANSFELAPYIIQSYKIRHIRSLLFLFIGFHFIFQGFSNGFKICSICGHNF